MCAVSMIYDHMKEVFPVRYDVPTWPADMAEIIRKAKLYDLEHGQPECELEQKKRELRELADKYGIKIDFL